MMNQAAMICSPSRMLLLGLFFLPFAVMAQQTESHISTPVELRPTPVEAFPPQYRADAPRPRKPFIVRYTCSEGVRLYVTFDNAQQTATIEQGYTTRYLKQGLSASGARYVNSDESYVFWVKGKTATINGRETCEAD
jgi:membrane-bound inhibitor of C-type lysozyme